MTAFSCTNLRIPSMALLLMALALNPCGRKGKNTTSRVSLAPAKPWRTRKLNRGSFIVIFVEFGNTVHDIETLRVLHQKEALFSRKRAWFTAAGKIRWKFPRPLKSVKIDQPQVKECFPIFNPTVRRSTFTSSSRWTTTTFRKFNHTNRAQDGGFMVP